MKVIEVHALTSDPGARLKFLEEFVGFGDDERRAITESAAVLGPQLPAILDALYDHLLNYDDTRRIFLGPDGEIDSRYIELRKEHLTTWVLKSIEGGERGAFAHYLTTVGQRHTGTEGDPRRAVPPRYMVALISYVQTALWSALFTALPDDPREVRRMGLAWNKMLVVQLEMFLKSMAPQWPRWD